MASTSTADKAAWREGDSCLAPDPRDGTLRESTIKRLTSSSHNNNETTAWVVFPNHDEDAEENEEETAEAVPVSKLMRPGLNHCTQEKPLFPSSVTDTRLCVPLELGHVGGHRVPYTINRYLRDYQREGIRFIYNNYIRSRGCILGDDMGLGKTVQVIGFLAAVLHKTGTWEDIQNNRPQFLQSQMTSSKQSKPNKVFLIVAPLSVLYNWKEELDTWGHFQCVVVHGLKKEEELARIRKGRIEIALTTYETLRLCLDQFNNIDWSAVIVDEAHKIKNPNSQITQAMKNLTCKIRVGLTGTILQNNLEELWCVMDWAIPGCLGNIGHFKNKFSDPIEHGQKHSATKRALATGRKTVRALVRKISHLFLRRTKALIKEQLPKKDDRVVYCTLTDFQRSVYQTVLDSDDVTLMLRSSEKCDCQSGKTRGSCCHQRNSKGAKIKTLYFSYMAILRKVANHVALLQSTAGTSKMQERYVAAICAEVFQKFPDFMQRCKDEAFEALSDPMYSGKMKVLQKLLKYYLQRRDKVLLFSLSTKLLNVLESYCMAEGLDYSRLDGNTKSKERVQIVKEFNNSSHINLCLVSTLAGGLGLNFVGANVVVLFDPTWNPASDLQAIDSEWKTDSYLTETANWLDNMAKHKAYRIGQCRDVTVLRLISLGTVEEVIYLRQVYKQQLQSSVVGKESARRYFEAVNGVYKGELFGLRNLFRLQTQGTCLTRKILEREGQVEAGVMTSSTHTGEEKEEEEETKRVSAPGDSADGPAPKEPAKEYRDASKMAIGVLDFSSGSEEDEEVKGLKRKVSNLNAVDGSRGVNDTTGPGRMSLFQHGFSRLLERVKGKPESAEGDSSTDIEESPSEEGAEDQKMEGTSSGIGKSSNAGNGAVCLPKLGKKTWDFTGGSDKVDREKKDGGRPERVSLLKQSDDAGRQRQDLKGWVDKKIVDEESDENSSPDKKKPYKLTPVPKVSRFEGYSDESEDFDLDAKTWPKRDASNSHGGGGDSGRGGPDCNRKRQSAKARSKARSKHTEDKETFTSSDEEHTPVKKGRSTEAATTDTTKRQAGTPKAVSFTSLKRQTSSAPKGKDVTIDSVLGGVNEVVYTHSNQRVVGGSKAEQRISRAAVRDVFERKINSQLPANHLLDIDESLSQSQPDSELFPSTVTLEKPSADHPVTFSNKIVLHNRHTTIIIGETPQAICRQQLEEMSQTFNYPSVQQFAKEILSGNSTHRLAWLRKYYTSQNHPDLTSTVTNNFPQPDSAQASSSSAATSSTSTKTAAKSHTHTRTPQKDAPKAKRKPKYTKRNPEAKTKPKTPQNNVPAPQTKPRKPQSDAPSPQRKQKIPRRNVPEPLNDVRSLESEEQEETACGARGPKRTKRGSVSSSGAFRAGGGLGLEQASSSGPGSGEAAAFLNRADRDIPSSPDLSHGRSTALSKPTAQGREQEREQKLSSRTSETFQGQRENPQTPSLPARGTSTSTSTSSHRSLLTDLIGDTSILDDLLKPRPRGAQQRDTPKTPPAPSSVSVSTCVTTPSPSRVTVRTDSPSAGCIDSLTSPKSNKPPSHPVVSKSSRRDFWDILNEGNEESINRLTDPAEVQRVCISAKFAARRRSKEEESKNLWKTNDKFLWKK